MASANSILYKKIAFGPKQRVKAILYFTIVMETLIVFGLPEYIRYINDLLLISVLVTLKHDIFCVFRKASASAYLTVVLAFALVCFFSGLLGAVPPLLMLWAFRNTFRGIVYVLCVVYYLRAEDIKEIFGILFWLQIINLALALYQFFVLHNNMDSVGGIFGMGNGAGVNAFNVLICSYFFASYLNHECSIIKPVISITCAFVIAGIAEEKMSYIALVFVIVMAVLVMRFTLRKAGVIALGMAAVIGGYMILQQLYPSMFEVMSSVAGIQDYLTGTIEGGYELPRVGSFAIISKLFFGGSLLRELFGIGFGGAETSSFDFLNSAFYSSYGYLHYRWFTHQWTFLETGWIGFISLLLIFVVSLICYHFGRRRGADSVLILVGICMASYCIISLWYNATLKIDMSYIAYFGVAAGFVASLPREEEQLTNK